MIYFTTVGVPEIESNNFIIYPNPNNGNFTVQFDNLLNENVNFEIFNIVGQLVYKKNLINATKHEVNLKEFSNGVYSIKITTTHSSISRKLIIQK
jgi:hypothetical protein